MNATTTLMLGLVAALATLAAPAAADGDATTASAAGPCEVFYYTIDPPGYQVDPSCLCIDPSCVARAWSDQESRPVLENTA